MLNVLKYDKPLMVNGQVFANSAAAYEHFKNYEGDVEIRINFKQAADINIQAVPQPVPQPQPQAAAQPAAQNAPSEKFLGKEFRIKVRQWMTKPSSPDFDYMKKWNNDIPMPMRIMFGTVLQETKGMLKMELHGKPEPTSICMACGRTLTHPVSLMYGIGPECGGHFHISMVSEAELEANMDAIRQKLADVKWTGWIAKSAIEEIEEAN